MSNLSDSIYSWLFHEWLVSGRAVLLQYTDEEWNGEIVADTDTEVAQ